MQNNNMEQTPLSSESEDKKEKYFLSLKMLSYLFGSLGTFSLGLLLVYYYWPPLVVSLPFGAAVTSFLFGVMETDTVQNKLDGVFTSPRVKIVAQLTGAVAVFTLFSGFAYFALDKELQRRDTELSIDKGKNDPTYIYLVPKSSVNENGGNTRIFAGKINLSNEFEIIKGNDKNDEGNVLHPILVKIRNECAYQNGLCSISDSIFPVHINNTKNLKLTNLNTVNEVNICPGHDYLEKRTLLISSDLNLIKSFKKDQSKKFPDNSYRVRINERSSPAICPDSNLTPPSPILLFGNRGMNKIPISQFSTYYAIDTGEEN